MFPIKNNAYACLLAVAAMLSLLSGGCGSNSSHNNGNMSQAQAQAVTQQVSETLAQALDSVFGVPPVSGVRPSLPAAVRNIRPDLSSGCTPNGSGETCNWPISYVAGCPQGRALGTITVAGDIEATLSGAGDGSVTSQLAITPDGCTISNLVINGDPAIDVGLNLTFANSAPVFPITLSEGGGISYGPNPSGSCKLNVTYTITSETSCTITGTACGQSINGGC